MYSKRSFDGYYFKTPGFYVFNIPIAVPYKKIYAKAMDAGHKLKEQFGPILESGKLFGSGWIGIEVEKPKADSDDVIHFTGQFETLEHKGPYKNLGKSCQKIKKERPDTIERFNLYLDDPETVAPENLRTLILFR
jgi:hypothetical protein